MRVKMLNSRVGVNVTFDGGSEYDLPEARALRWIAAGFAVSVEDVAEAAPAEVEFEPVDAAPEPETPVATAPAPRRGRRK
ncbi:hypothetical protein [Sinorhizobium sp. BJ1]|uniref:hypothetical protein n=1 Tax=Sinorhizobium sp. BJ1 TaxID=2035455 RepID=UPI000BE7E8F8|nr:hypothetical protein [Sinorhizobium sp. BJ1]PDT79964.1 hypothetical protein CO676_30420 [Sinorhizobium sp. BJ1]